MGMWVTMSPPQGWRGTTDTLPEQGHLPSGPDGHGEDGEVTPQCPERGLARHSQGGRDRLGGLQASGPRCPGGLQGLCWPQPQL